MPKTRIKAPEAKRPKSAAHKSTASACGTLEKDIREIDIIQDNRQEDPLTELQKEDLKLLITKGLSRAERLIVILYYYEEMTMKEIGMTLGLSKSRVSQLHRSALARLRERMQYRSKEF
jgi:RNA polymerase sigma factor for flagellar operon FliA